MSVLDAFFNKGGFKGAKCKTLLKLTIPRIKLLRNRREIQLKQMRRDIAKLLEGGQEATARIRVEHIIREENMMAAQEILELFCELIVVRLPIIETQRECPLDLKEAISSLCFAAPRCADLPELQQVQMLFAAKYGREFVAAATELMPDCGVNRQIIELLSVRAPAVEAKLKLLKEIAAEHEVEWDPASSETEFLKPHEDLLNGPNHVISGATAELLEEKHDVSIPSAYVEGSHEHPESDSEVGFDSLDLPEVPKVSVRPNFDTAVSPDIAPTVQATSPPDMGFHHEPRKSASSTEEIPQKPGLESTVGHDSSDVVPSDLPSVSVRAKESEQFVPFVASPPPSVTIPARQSETLASVSEPVPSFAAGLSSSPTPFAKQSEKMSSIPEPVPSFAAGLSSSPTPAAKQSEKMSSIPEPVHSLSRNKSEVNVDLEDVLAAARAAADTAERAAAAARSAASLAQVRITELVMKMNNNKNFEKANEDSAVKESASRVENSPDNSGDGVSKVPTAPSEGVPKLEPESPSSFGRVSAHQPQRLTSLEDDPYFSYPNLFSRQGSTVRSSTDNSPSAH